MDSTDLILAQRVVDPDELDSARVRRGRLEHESSKLHADGMREPRSWLHRRMTQAACASDDAALTTVPRRFAPSSFITRTPSFDSGTNGG